MRYKSCQLGKPEEEKEEEAEKADEEDLDDDDGEDDLALASGAFLYGASFVHHDDEGSRAVAR